MAPRSPRRNNGVYQLARLAVQGWEVGISYTHEYGFRLAAKKDGVVEYACSSRDSITEAIVALVENLPIVVDNEPS